MARLFVADGVGIVACTPHIMPGVWNNDAPGILAHMTALQQSLDQAEIPLSLVIGADIHVAPDLAEGLRAGAIPSLHGTRYALIEPPHHVFPPRLDEIFFSLLAAGYVPVLTHPERLTWIARHYDVILRLFEAGVWMQLTAGALLGDFGKGPQYWAERMLAEGRSHLLATDAHNAGRRRPRLRAGFEAAAGRVGEEEAAAMVYGRPLAMLENRPPSEIAPPRARGSRPAQAEARKSLWSRVLKTATLRQ